MGQVLVGISSWTEKTLIEGGRFYPPDVTGVHKLNEDRAREER